ncbi:PREDICTED: solute carrier organic anion transporter family member 3A1 [Condylura cristata]|uniref:solute carrier organic anion transporter family member 3A1 n=1 Tax=Condylura cristata TaxID=143302 RepID=UPI000642F334|nr:PREDICTED: solute carrier organic anion transporter family member 3A1 [Condylura cristata]
MDPSLPFSRGIRAGAGEATSVPRLVLCSVPRPACGRFQVSVLTTLERRFNLQSADVGVIASSFEIGNLALILFVSYFGARGHRPRLIGCGGIVMALGALLSALPEFLTHQYKYEAGEIRWGAEGRDVCAANGSGSHQGPDPDLICRSRTATNMMYLLLIGAQVLLGIGATPVQPLGVSYIDDHVRRKDSSLYIGILFTMLVFGPACGFILGSFCTKIYVDAVFIDTSKEHAPGLTGAHSASPLTEEASASSFQNLLSKQCAAGPLGSESLGVAGTPGACCVHPEAGATPLQKAHAFVSLRAASRPPGHRDRPESLPRTSPLPAPGAALPPWVAPVEGVCSANDGAEAPLPSVTCSWSVVQGPGQNHRCSEADLPGRLGRLGLVHPAQAFPPQVQTIERGQARAAVHPGLLEALIPKVTKHLLSNPVFTCIILAACMEIAVVAGFAAFLGKYLEQQFNLTTSSANQLLGMTAIPCACLGIFLGGLLVKKLSLSALGAIRMAMLVNLVSTACYVSFLFLGCDTGPVAGVTVPYGNTSAPGSVLDPYSPCNKNCECQTDSFTPVCGADGITYLSACFAGCNSTNLTGCACLTTVPPENATVVPGKCPSPGCREAFLTFLCVMCACSMIGAMAQTPSVIILIRTVSPELKSYALGVLFLLLRLLGFIPPPLIFGAGIDSTCLFWSAFCGGQGACVLYDNVAYRHLYVSIAIALKSFAFVLYTTTWQCLRKNYARYIKNHEGGLSTSTEYQDIEPEKACPESRPPSEDSFVSS